MSESFFTVEEAAERLKLHPKTVLRFIREDRLRATRVGKAFRIRRADVDELLGVPPSASVEASAWATVIVDIPGSDGERARKLARQVPSALQMRSPDSPNLRADVIHDPERAHAKVVIVGPPGDAARLLSLIETWLEP